MLLSPKRIFEAFRPPLSENFFGGARVTNHHVTYPGYAETGDFWTAIGGLDVLYRHEIDMSKNWFLVIRLVSDISLCVKCRFFLYNGNEVLLDEIRKIPMYFSVSDDLELCYKLVQDGNLTNILDIPTTFLAHPFPPKAQETSGAQQSNNVKG